MNRGFLYGDGFFETLRVSNGTIPLIEYHIKRIDEALAIYLLEPEFNIDVAFLEEIASSYGFEDGIIRINFFREGEGKYLPNSNRVGFTHAGNETLLPFVLPTNLDVFKDLRNLPLQKGVITTYSEPKPQAKHLTVKSLSSAYYVLAALFKQEVNADYLLLTNSKGQVLEELSSNILIQKGDELLIPPLDGGQVVGATLRYLLAHYSGEIIEHHFTLEEAINADAMYITRATTGIHRIN